MQQVTNTIRKTYHFLADFQQSKYCCVFSYPNFFSADKNSAVNLANGARRPKSSSSD